MLFCLALQITGGISRVAMATEEHSVLPASVIIQLYLDSLLLNGIFVNIITIQWHFCQYHLLYILVHLTPLTWSPGSEPAPNFFIKTEQFMSHTENHRNAAWDSTILHVIAWCMLRSLRRHDILYACRVLKGFCRPNVCQVCTSL